MQFVSTRGASPAVGFPDVMLAGLAPDGGLYVPESWPDVSPLGDDRNYPELLARMVSPYVGDSMSADDLLGMAQRATRGFPQPDVVPLRELGEGIFILELFWGPTLAFKDLALQMLGQLFGHTGRPVTVIGATSGDTGSATIEAFRGLSSVQVVVLHPEGLISEFQRRQMTTVDAPNIHNIAVLGTFDDCQSLVKRLLADEDLRNGFRLASANSINWLRIAAQTAYYGAAAVRLGAVLDFSVPSGNFGNAFSGYTASRMGVPIARIGVATNLNRGLADLLTTGVMTVGPPVRTMSPAMDIQLPSNLERALFEALGRDPDALRAAMAGLLRAGSLELAAQPLARLRSWFTGMAVDEGETAAEMADFRRQNGRLIDPHTAVALVGARRLGDQGRPRVALATAHPAKFGETVARATGVVPALPEGFADVMSGPERFVRLPAHYPTIRSMVLEVAAGPEGRLGR